MRFARCAALADEVFGKNGRSFDHIGKIVPSAQIVEPIKWPFELDVIVKESDTRPFVELNWRAEKRSRKGPSDPRFVCRTPTE